MTTDVAAMAERQQRDSMTQRRPTWQVVAALFLLALLIRVIDLGGRSLWVDEGATYVLSRPGLSEILRDQDSDVAHPPGYYALIHLTTGEDPTEAALRLPSAVVSALTVVMVFVIGLRLGGFGFGLLAAAILLLSPLDLWYAQEARQPVFAAAAVVGAAWGLLRGGWPGRIASIVILVVGAYLDYITAAGWFGLGALWLVASRRREDVRFSDWVVTTLVAAAVYVPFQGPEFAAGFEDLLVHEGAGVWYGRILGSNPLTASALGLLVVGGLAAYVAFKVADLVTGSERAGRLWSGIVVAGFAAASFSLWVPRAYSVKKVLVVGWPVVAVLIAFLLLHRVGPRWRRPMVIGVLVLSLVGSALTFTVGKDDWRSATAHVNANAMAGDVAWVREDIWADNAYVYYRGALPVFHDEVPGSNLPTDGDVWLITYRRPQDPVGEPSLAAEAWFDDNWELVEEIPFYRLAVRHYEAP
jgi:hypothetical protein